MKPNFKIRSRIQTKNQRSFEKIKKEKPAWWDGRLYGPKDPFKILTRRARMQHTPPPPSRFVRSLPLLVRRRSALYGYIAPNRRLAGQRHREADPSVRSSDELVSQLILLINHTS